MERERERERVLRVMEKFFGAAKRALGEAGSLFREAAHDAAYDLRDNALRGFGLPKLVTTAASLSVAGFAAVGTAAITSELISKVYVSRECKTCNGWGGLRCTMCVGTGHVQYSTTRLSKTKRASIENLADDLLDGKEEIIHHPAEYNAGYPLPYKKCPTCSGTGVSRCQECKGFPFNPRISLDNLMDVPWKTWDVYRKTHPPREDQKIYENVKDPALAAFLLYERDEIEGGFKYDEDVKARLMAAYQRYREYDEIREEVATRRPGWEQLQEALYSIDPERAKRDPVIIQDVSYYKALKQVEAEVALLKVPPRPAEWTEKYEPLLKKLYGADDEKNLLKSEDIRTLVEVRDDLMDQVLNAAWTNEWRDRKVEEVVQKKISPYIEAEESGKALQRRKLDAEAASGHGKEKAPSATKQLDTKASQKKADKSQKADKKKERQERLAKQAAEREAALTKAKKT